MARKDLDYGVRAIQGLLRRLEQPESLASTYARLILDQAVENAAGRPTPQAPMAVANLVQEGANIGPLAGGAPAEVAIGSEFGSSLYRQFHAAPNPRGYWLYPATRDDGLIRNLDRELESLLDEMTRRAAI